MPDRATRWWETATSREARNEQRKLRGALLNAPAIALLIGAAAVDFLNPELARILGWPERLLMLAGAIAAHLLACALVRDIEDKP